MSFESKESIRIVDSEVDQISVGVSLRESDSANVNLENNSLISFKLIKNRLRNPLNPFGVDLMDLHMNWETRI